MWGETLFNIDEDDYGDYDQNLEEKVNTVQPSEVMYKRFKKFYDGWIAKIEHSKSLMPEFKASRVRRFIKLEYAKVEENVSYLDHLEDANLQSELFHKICNVFLALDVKLTEIERKVSAIFKHSLTPPFR